MERPKLIQPLDYKSRKGRVEPVYMNKNWNYEKELKESSVRIIDYINQDNALDLVKQVIIEPTNFDGRRPLDRKAVFYLGRDEDSAEIERLLKIYADETRHDHKLKAPIMFGQSLVRGNTAQICGWHCFDRDFIFFTYVIAMDKYIGQMKQVWRESRGIS